MQSLNLTNQSREAKQQMMKNLENMVANQQRQLQKQRPPKYKNKVINNPLKRIPQTAFTENYEEFYLVNNQEKQSQASELTNIYQLQNENIYNSRQQQQRKIQSPYIQTTQNFPKLRNVQKFQTSVLKENLQDKNQAANDNHNNSQIKSYVSADYIRRNSTHSEKREKINQNSSGVQQQKQVKNIYQESFNSTQHSIHKNSAYQQRNVSQSCQERQTISKSQSQKMNQFLEMLTDEDQRLYGDRMIDGFQKINLLGKGGFAVVWLCKDILTQQKVAIKQMIRQNTEDSFQKELKVYTGLDKYENHEGLQGITKLIKQKQCQRDLWLVYELGGTPISKSVYNMKGEFHKGQRLYRINFNEIYQNLFQSNSSYIQEFVRQMAYTLDILQKENLIHCDIKPENILVQEDQINKTFSDIKLIDFGSCFDFNDKGQVSMVTPEYMPPEVINLFSTFGKQHQNKTQIEMLRQQAQPWSIDVWSLGMGFIQSNKGCILVELLTGVPHWLCYKCRVTMKGKDSIKTGLFAVKGQDYNKIFIKQKLFAENIGQNLKDSLSQFQEQDTALDLLDLIEQMMQFNPKNRISPQQILQHSFLKN